MQERQNSNPPSERLNMSQDDTHASTIAHTQSPQVKQVTSFLFAGHLVEPRL